MAQERKRGAPAAAPEQEWLTLPQVARLYGVTRQRVGQLVREGKIEAVKSGVRWRVSRRWLDAQHAQSGGIFPAADGRGLVGFYGATVGALADDEAFWERWRAEAVRVLREEWPALMLEFAALPARAAARRDGELAERRRSG